MKGWLWMMNLHLKGRNRLNFYFPLCLNKNTYYLKIIYIERKICNVWFNICSTAKYYVFLTCLTRFKKKTSCSPCSYVALHILCQHHNTRLYSVSILWCYAAPLKNRKLVYKKKKKEYIQHQQDLKCGFLLGVRGQLKCDGTRAETRFRLSAKRKSPFKSAGASVQSITGSRGVRISGSNAGYTMFRDSVKGTGYPFHSPVSPSLPLPCVTVCIHISTAV
jgi:hypothetical protein